MGINRLFFKHFVIFVQLDNIRNVLTISGRFDCG